MSNWRLSYSSLSTNNYKHQRRIAGSGMGGMQHHCASHEYEVVIYAIYVIAIHSPLLRSEIAALTGEGYSYSGKPG